MESAHLEERLRRSRPQAIASLPAERRALELELRTRIENSAPVPLTAGTYFALSAEIALAVCIFTAMLSHPVRHSMDSGSTMTKAESYLLGSSIKPLELMSCYLFPRQSLPGTQTAQRRHAVEELVQ